jgi:anthranilate phosphoribosyltransferase
MVGVFSVNLLPLYADVLRLLERQHAWVVHGAGMDELSTIGISEVHAVKSSGVSHSLIDPAQLGFLSPALAELQGGDKAANAAILAGILDGTVLGPKRDMVVLNAGAAFVVAGLANDLAAGIAFADEQIGSGKALSKLREMQSAIPL